MVRWAGTITKSSESVPSGLEPDPDSRLPDLVPLVSIGRETESSFGGEFRNPAEIGVQCIIEAKVLKTTPTAGSRNRVQGLGSKK